MGASQSRLAKAGGNAQLASQMLADEYAAGAKGWSAAQKAAFANPATRDAWVAQEIDDSTKGKVHGIAKTIGGVVKKAAPIAALAIPGLGPVAAGLIAAGGSAAGGALHGDKFNLGSTLLAGAGGAAGNLALGGKGISKLLGSPSAAGAATAAASPGGQGTIGKIGDWIGKHPMDAAQLALAGVGTYQGAQRAGQADQLRRRALSSVNPDAPFESGLPGPDEHDPYASQNQYAPSRARRAALASLNY